jgi:PAS domain S-box-containing protein
MTSSGVRQPDPVELEGVLNRAADGACATTGTGRIALWNAAAERILGYPAREVVGRTCCEVFAGRDVAGNRLCYAGCHVVTLVQRGEPVQHFQMATRTKLGKPVWLDVSILVAQAARRDLGTTVHLFRDVTATREIETLVREHLACVAQPPRPDGTSGHGELTRRELEILRLIAGGANTRVMAERLRVSPATVRNHVQNLLGKLQVHSRLEAAAYATRHGLANGHGG